MNKTFTRFLSTAAVILVASVAVAQTAASTGTNTVSGVNSRSQSASGAVAGGGQALGNSTSLLNGATIGDSVTSSVKNDAPAIAPNLAGLYASPHTCMGSASASVGINGVFAAGAGSTYQDNECNKREAVKLAAQLGLKGAAAAVFYDIEVVRNVMGTATNAGEVARAEAAQLAGVQVVQTPAKTATSSTAAEAAPAAANNGKPFWCSTIDRNNARWNECQ